MEEIEKCANEAREVAAWTGFGLLAFAVCSALLFGIKLAV